MIRPGGYRGLCRVRAILESLGTMVWARARSLSRWYSLMQPPASRLAADVGVEPQPQHITEHAIVFHWNNSRTNRSFNYRSRRDKCWSWLESVFLLYLRIDASLYSVDEVRPQTFHLSKPDPRYYVLAHHYGSDKFLRVLLGRHAQQSTGWPEWKAHQVWVILFQQDRENRRRTSAQRMPHQGQPELMRTSRGILRRNLIKILNNLLNYLWHINSF